MRKMKFNPDYANKGKCVNGCNEPVCAPSKVLCARCLDALGDKIKNILAIMERRKIKSITPR